MRRLMIIAGGGRKKTCKEEKNWIKIKPLGISEIKKIWLEKSTRGNMATCEERTKTCLEERDQTRIKAHGISEIEKICIEKAFLYNTRTILMSIHQIV